MKSIILILFIIGIIFITIGYTQNYSQCPAPKIEYRYVPRSFFEEQITSINLKKYYSDVFNQPSTWATYPFNDKIGKYNKKNFSNFVKKN